MATSVVDICNNALIRIGSKTITSLSDGDKVANSCNLLYTQTRDLLLRQHFWNFAVTRVQLASESTSPGFEFDYSYPLPSDFIRAIGLYESIFLQYSLLSTYTASLIHILDKPQHLTIA
jgi:hypothetical protein